MNVMTLDTSFHHEKNIYYDLYVGVKAVFQAESNTTMQIYVDFSVIETTVGCHC